MAWRALAGTPAGVRNSGGTGSGGVASLNHRLQDEMPPASECRRAVGLQDEMPPASRQSDRRTKDFTSLVSRTMRYPGGMKSCSRWLSEARATPPDGGASIERHPGGMKSCSRWLSETRATPPDRGASIERHPGGMKSCSRWLSEARATPPDRGSSKLPHPGGMPSWLVATTMAGTPAGVRNSGGTGSGGVASLNHRLQAVKPPASEIVPSACRETLIQAEKLRISSRSPSVSVSRSRISCTTSARSRSGWWT